MKKAENENTTVPTGKRKRHGGGRPKGSKMINGVLVRPEDLPKVMRKSGMKQQMVGRTSKKASSIDMKIMELEEQIQILRKAKSVLS